MEWISVKDRLPITGDNCLIKLKGDENLGWAGFDGDYWWEKGYDSMTIGEITHWIYASKIPLPEEPKDE